MFGNKSWNVTRKLSVRRQWTATSKEFGPAHGVFTLPNTSGNFIKSFPFLCSAAGVTNLSIITVPFFLRDWIEKFWGNRRNAEHFPHLRYERHCTSASHSKDAFTNNFTISFIKSRRKAQHQTSEVLKPLPLALQHFSYKKDTFGWEWNSCR